MAGKGFKLADAYVEVHGDGSKVVDDVAQDVDKGAPKAKSSGMSLAKGFVGGFVAYEGFKVAKDFIGDSISNASDLNETVSASQQIFGKSAGAIASWADTAATKMGLSKQAAIEAATGFGDMLSQIGFTQDAATKNSKSIVQMAADLGSFKNLPTGDVLDMISGAMRGEYDSLQRVIPNISAARVQHEAMAMGLVKTTVDTKALANANTAADLAQQAYTDAVKKHGKESAEAQRAGLALSKANDAVNTAAKGTTGTITAQAQAQATLAIIQKDGKRAMGDFGRTSSGVANQQKIMAAQTEDLKATLGTALLPIVKTLMNVFTTTFLPILKGVASWIAKNKDVIGPLVIVLGILAAAIWVVNIALDANPIVLIIMGVMALIVAIVLLITNWDAVIKFLSAAWQGFVTWFVGVMVGFGGWVSGWWQGFIGWIVSVWQGFIGWIVGVWAGFVGWLRDGLNAVLGWWNAGWAAIASTVSAIWSGIVRGAVGAWQGFIGWLSGIIGGIGKIITGVIGTIGRIGHDIVQGLWDGIRDAWGRFTAWWQGIIGGIADVAKKLLGIHSPSQVFRYEVGAQIVEGANLGLKDKQASLKRTVTDVFDVSGDASAAFGANSVKGKGAGGDTYNFGDITVQADQLSDMQKAIETLKALAQAARQGKGTTAGIG